MTYNQRIINDRPAYFFPLQEGATAFVDQMGSGPASVNGSPQVAPSLVVGGTTAYVLNGNDNFRFACRVFNEDSVQSPFSLEAWFKPVDVTAGKGIVGHAGQTDGLWFDGEAIHFSTNHTDGTVADASFFPTSLTGSFHVVGVHTGSKNELYVNGIRVAAVDLTPSQIDSRYALTVAPGFLYVGHLSGSIIVDAVAVYSQALTSKQVRLHFLWGKDAPDLRNVVSQRNGTYWTFTDTSSVVAFDYRFDTNAEWFSGDTTSISRENDMLLPAFGDDGLTRAGVWMAGFILGAVGDKIDGSKIEWDADGPVVVHTSLNNGNSWAEATNGWEVPGIMNGFFPGEQSLIVRVGFPAGEQPDTITKMRSLSIKLYQDRTSAANIAGADAVFSGNYSLASFEAQPIDHEDRAGVNLYRSSVSLPSDATRTIEFWVNLHTSPAVDQYIFDARPGTNTYLRWSGSQWSTSADTTIFVNGVQRAGAAINIVPRRWTHIVAVVPAGINTPVVVGDRNLPMNLGMCAVYQSAFTPNGVSSLYNAYLGIPTLAVSEASGLAVVDPPKENVKIYAYPWSLQSSG